MATRSVPVWRHGEIAAKAVVDEEDFEKVAEQVWYLMTRGTHRKRYYAQAFGKASDGRRQPLYMHRVILGLTKRTQHADRIDGEGLNNRRSNLWPTTAGQNNQNQWKTKAYAGRPTSSRFRGVSWETAKQRWRGQIRMNGTQVFSRLFRTELEAARAVAEARARLMPFSQEAQALRRSA
jgi:hypothetical protein